MHRLTALALFSLAAVACQNTGDTTRSEQTSGSPQPQVSSTATTSVTTSSYEPAYPAPVSAAPTTSTPATTVAAATAPVSISAPPVTPGDVTSVQRINVPEASTLLASGQAVMVDVRSADSFNQSHIKGALHVSGAELASYAGMLPKDKKIIFYCT